MSRTSAYTTNREVELSKLRRKLMEENLKLRDALLKIRDSKHCQYDENGAGSYGIGVTDGHRFCAGIARKALEWNDSEVSE
jgi:hypothetical protein